MAHNPGHCSSRVRVHPQTSNPNCKVCRSMERNLIKKGRRRTYILTNAVPRRTAANSFWKRRSRQASIQGLLRVQRGPAAPQKM